MKFFLILIFCISAFASLSCKTQDVPYRAIWPGVSSTISSGRVAVIELDEQGDLWDGNQIQGAINLIKEKGDGNPLLITYVHGWRNDATDETNDLKLFCGFMERLGKVKPVGMTPVGVFIGWRGSAVHEKIKGVGPAFAMGTTFWNRKAATGRMAGIGFNRAIGQTGAAARKLGGKVVLVGHSFGGRIVERAIGNSLSSQLGLGSSFKSPADLVVLVNPATESLTAREIKLALRDWKESYPLIVAITSKTDGPNKTAWPLGYCVSKFALQVPPDRNYIVSLKHSDGTAETYLEGLRGI